MPRKPNVVPLQGDAAIAEDEKPFFVLKKSAGFVLNGRTSHHFPAGTEFDPATDADTIAALIRSGAQFE